MDLIACCTTLTRKAVIPNLRFSSKSLILPFQSQNKAELFMFSKIIPLYIKNYILSLHQQRTSKMWIKAANSLVIRQLNTFCSHIFSSESGQFIGLRPRISNDRYKMFLMFETTYSI